VPAIFTSLPVAVTIANPLSALQMREKWGAKRPVQAGAKVAGLPFTVIGITLAGAPFLARPMREKWGVKHPVQAAQGGILHQPLGIRTGMTVDLG